MYNDELAEQIEQNHKDIDALQELAQAVNRMTERAACYQAVTNLSVSFTAQGARATVTTKKSLFISSRA